MSDKFSQLGLLLDTTTISKTTPAQLGADILTVGRRKLTIFFQYTKNTETQFTITPYVLTSMGGTAFQLSDKKSTSGAYSSDLVSITLTATKSDYYVLDCEGIPAMRFMGVGNNDGSTQGTVKIFYALSD